MSAINHDKTFCDKKFLGYIFICRNAEGVHAYLSKCWRDAYASVGMLKGYMVRERLGTPASKSWPDECLTCVRQWLDLKQMANDSNLFWIRWWEDSDEFSRFLTYIHLNETFNSIAGWLWKAVVWHRMLCKTTQAAVLPTLRFSREFGLVFLKLRVFFKTCGLLVFGLVLIEICLFLQISVFLIPFFSNFMAILCFNLLQKAYWACFCENLVTLGLFFRICHPDFLFNLIADFSFCCIFLPTHVGLVFRWNYLFLACFSCFLACFCKITRHHCQVVTTCHSTYSKSCFSSEAYIGRNPLHLKVITVQCYTTMHL